MPSGNENECALILKETGFECGGILRVSLLDDVVQFFGGKRERPSTQHVGGARLEKAID